MDIMLLHRQGLSRRRIADRLGIHRKTVSSYIRKHEAGQGVEQIIQQPRKSKLDRFAENIEHWLKEDIGYQATWIYDRLCNMGFDGSYEIVKRRVNQIKAERQHIAYIRFETEPGCQAQVDFGEFQVELPCGNIRKYYLFSMILGYSRKIYAALVERCDLPTFLDCHLAAFAHFGGVPQEILYDRMKNVYIGKVAGRDKFNDTLTAFALHYGFKPEVAPAYASWVKGKVERPFSFIREGFWRGYGFISLQLANRDLLAWLSRKDERIHGTTHEKVSVRFEREQPHLQPLSPNAFDTSYRIYRKVQKDCTVSFEGNRYVAPHRNPIKVIQYEPLDTVLSLGVTNFSYNLEKNRLLNAGPSGFSYDSQGQQIGQDSTVFTFDKAHRLTQVSGLSTTKFFYDGNGNRLKAERDGVVTKYVYDKAGRLVAEADVNNVITRYYIHGRGLMAMVTAAGQSFVYHYNPNGNTVAITDSTESIVNKYAYTPFGAIVNEVEAIPQPFKFVGETGVMAEPTGLYYMKARYYNPALSRFISEDPLGFGGDGPNFYTYALNNPVLLMDPSGLATYLAAFGTWNGNTSFSEHLGQIVTIKVTNVNVIPTTIIIRSNNDGSRQGHILPFGRSDFRFSTFGAEPIPWTFYIRSVSDAFIVSYEIWTTK